MTPEELLQECETLFHNGRMRRMVELGQLAASDPGIRETLTELALGDVYQRILALQSCYGSRDTAHIVRAFSDPSRSMRVLALNLAPLVCSDAELQIVFVQIQPALQKVLVRNLCCRHRYAPVDRYLETLANRNDAHQIELLPYGSPMLVAQHVEQVSNKLDLVSLKHWARHHPERIIKHLLTLASTRTTLDPQLVFQINTVLPILIKSVNEQRMAGHPTGRNPARCVAARYGNDPGD